jgi:hypothetical protein
MDTRHVWVSDPEQVWKIHIVTNDNLKTGELSISSDKGRTNTTIKKEATVEVIEDDLQDFDDINSLDSIVEAPILDLIRRRYAANKFFIHADNVLLFVNPFKPMAELDPKSFYDIDVDDSNDDDREPHIYSFTNAVFQSLCGDGSGEGKEFACCPKGNVNKSIIINGRSGSGKTQMDKMIVEFLLAANSIVKGGMEYAMPDLSGPLNDAQIIQESFGFAATAANSNASRVSKYTCIFYAKNNCMVSASSQLFGADISRVVKLNEKDRNFHVFYEVLRGLRSTNASFAGKLRLSRVEDFSILTEGNCSVIGNEQRDVENFLRLTVSLSNFGFSEKEIEGMWELLAIILHLGNVQGRNGAAAEPLTCATMDVDSIISMLGIDKTQFLASMTAHMMTVGNKRTIPCGTVSAENSERNIESVMKYLYRKLFLWVTKKVNYQLGIRGQDCGEVAEKFIGILDLAGFEISSRNSLEQLFINYSSEVFQQQFLQQKFLAEQAAYDFESISWTPIPIHDNSGVIELLTKKTGVFAILEEHSMMNRKPDDKALLSALNAALEGSQEYSKPRFGSEYFIVKHYQEDVVYTVNTFLIHNNENLHSEMNGYLSDSKNKMVRAVCLQDSNVLQPGEIGYIATATQALVENVLKEKGETLLSRRKTAEQSSPKRPTTPKGVANFMHKMGPSTALALASVSFRDALNDVLNSVKSSEQCFVTCFRSNEHQKPGVFEAAHFLTQYRSTCISESLLMKRLRYELKIPFLDFIGLYGCLQTGGGTWKSVLDSSDTYAAKMLTTNITASVLHVDSYRIGTNYIFLTSVAVDDLEYTLKTVSPGAVRLANVYRPRKGMVVPALTDEQAQVAMRLKRHEKLSSERKHNDDLAAVVAEQLKQKQIADEQAAAAAAVSGKALPRQPTTDYADYMSKEDVDPEALKMQRDMEANEAKTRFQENKAKREADIKAVEQAKTQQQTLLNKKSSKTLGFAEPAGPHNTNAGISISSGKEMYNAEPDQISAEIEDENADDVRAYSPVKPSKADKRKTAFVSFGEAYQDELEDEQIHGTASKARLREESKRRQSAVIGSFGEMYDDDNDAEEGDGEEEREDTNEDGEEGDGVGDLPRTGKQAQQNKRGSVFESSSPFQAGLQSRPAGTKTGVALPGMVTKKDYMIRTFSTQSNNSDADSPLHSENIESPESPSPQNKSVMSPVMGGRGGAGGRVLGAGRGRGGGMGRGSNVSGKANANPSPTNESPNSPSVASTTAATNGSPTGSARSSPRNEPAMPFKPMPRKSREFSESHGIESLVPAFKKYRLRRRVGELFRKCSMGDVFAVHKLLCAHPSDQLLLGRVEFVRDQLKGNYRVENGKVYNSSGVQVLSRYVTLAQAAVISGNCDMLEYLELSPEEIVPAMHCSGKGDNARARNTATKESLVHFAVRVNSSLAVVKNLVDICCLQYDTAGYVAPSTGSQNGVLKKGWLYKKDSTKSWSLRFVTLTDAGLKYGSKEDDPKFKDFFPLHVQTARFGRVNSSDGTYVFSVTLDNEKSTIKKRSTVLLKAPGENELHEWMKALSQCARLEKFRPGPMTYWDMDSRHQIVTAVTSFKETIIHSLAQCMQSSEQQVVSVSDDAEAPLEPVQNMIAVCAWLVSAGCSITAVDKRKKSALEVAVDNSNLALAVTLRDLINTHANRVRPPKFYPFYTYACLHFQRMGR